jgi:hypothetical protein
MNEEQIFASPFYSTTPSPLYLALPKLDLPHTHIPGGWGLTSTKKEWEGRKEAKVRSCLQVCCPILTPSTSIYRWGHWRQLEQNIPGMASKTNGGPPCVGLGSVDQRSFRPIPGSADPHVAYLGFCFLWVADWWVLLSVPGVHVCWVRFGHSDGPWIHGRYVWRSLIRWGSLSRIGDIIDPGDACMATPHGWAWSARIKEACFLLISYAKHLYSTLYSHLCKLPVLSPILMWMHDSHIEMQGLMALN